jgi:endogenous inhibitor of DNA gyrase (YacG/DUF329 family)
MSDINKTPKAAEVSAAGEAPKKPRAVNCPTCAKPVVWEAASRWRPFCSERCKLIDIGAWASETYRVAGPELDPGEGNEDVPPL